jgi:Concanavalin A-like lectin/glucanases superfamily/Bacterial Ig domain/Purple acid Phosphatase, N-terminal domain/Calcineurin-like phosphoesterase
MKPFVTVFCLVWATLASGQSLKPYLQSMTDHSVWVGWRTTADTSTTIFWGADPMALTQTLTGNTHTFSANYLWHSVKLDNLLPNTAYYYKVKTGALESPVFRFRTYQTPENASGRIRILIVGDTQHPTTATRTFQSAKAKLIEKYGPDVEDQLHLILKQGDNVDAGVLGQYISMHFDPLSVLSGNVPTMTVVGNHEYYQNNDLSYYFPHMEYDDADLLYNDLSGENGEHYYAFRVGGALFCMMNSNEWWATQTNWLANVVAAANADPTVKFIFGTAHHPLRCENWVSDGSAYIRDQVMPRLRQSEKTAMYTSGHSHMYARGSSRDSAVWEMISGGGGLIQNWNENAEQNYPDVQRSFDVWTYQIMELDLDAGTMDVETYSIGNEEYVLDNVLIDQFHRYFGQQNPNQPGIAATPDVLVTMPHTFSGTPYQSPIAEPFNSTEFELAGASGDFQNDLILNLKRDFEDFYQIESPAFFSPIDQNAGVNIFDITLDSTQVFKGKNWLRVRYRDQNLEWSDWSAPFPFEAANGREPLPQEPIAWWRFNGNAVDTTGHGFDGTLPTTGVTFENDQPMRGTVAVFDNTQGIPVQTGVAASNGLPTVQMTVSGWVKVDAADEWGGFIGCLQDNGSFERGWVLGTRNRKFSFALASEGTGGMTYLSDTQDFNLGEWYYVTATYNGASMRLFVNGQLRVTSTAQQGDILYAGMASDWFGLGAYVDENENWRHDGALDEVILWARALSDAEVAALYMQSSNLAPTVSITSPAPNATFIAPANITVSATADDMDGNVSVVEFYAGVLKLFEDTDGAPYGFVWENVPAGIHEITAKATDNFGAKTFSVPVEAVVLVNIPPVVSIVSPGNGAVFSAPATITVMTDANDLDGNVALVEFFNGSDKIGEDQDGAPYFFTWNDVPEGEYPITAKATDNNGGETTSAPVLVRVETSVQSLEPVVPGQLRVSPNPGSGIFQLLCSDDLNHATASVYGADNQLVVQKKVQGGFVDLSTLPAGIYQLKIQGALGKQWNTWVVRL